MKNLFLISTLFIAFLSCEKNNNCLSSPSVHSGICIDPALINDTIACIEIAEPVCGCDGVTYDNYCYAEKAGITSYVPGKCCVK
tara:strand:- start:5232 stop:5483 length:252 start_codon:yes stop_codon:yes gene_type:complete